MALPKPLWLLTGAALLAAGMPALGRDDPALVQRMERMERMLDSRGLMEMLERLEQLQSEVAQLRGELEVQTHSLDGLQRRQRELYLDIDRRLHRLEVAGVQTPAPGAGAPPLTTAPAPAPGTTPGVPPLPKVPTPMAEGDKVLDAAKERDAYEHALDILKEGRYEQAAKAFRVFLASHPGSRYAGNAQYWLGEAFYVTRKFDTALAEFDKVVQEYPNSAKQADARLKMGFIQYEQQDWATARQTLELVASRYPDSTAARLAKDRLQRMTQEGH